MFHKRAVSGDSEADDVLEGVAGGEQILMTNRQSAELSQSDIGLLHDPAPRVEPHFAPIFIDSSLVLFPVRCNQLDGSLFQPLKPRIEVVSGIGDRGSQLLPCSYDQRGNADFFEYGSRDRIFHLRRTCQDNSKRRTLTVNEYHPLRPTRAGLWHLMSQAGDAMDPTIHFRLATGSNTISR